MITKAQKNTLLALLFSLGVALGSGVKHGFYQPAFDSKEQNQSAQAEFGRAEYEQLKPGMSLTEVRSILYRGIEVSRSVTTAIFVWENPDGSKITATFESDRLKSKEQSGLK
ncbi:hypothetical protein FJR05_14115 [Dolichospermum sp. UHCC 0259]|nr:hypothetical protein [Dolichospermum sp. UHCC 0259]